MKGSFGPVNQARDNALVFCGLYCRAEITVAGNESCIGYSLPESGERKIKTHLQVDPLLIEDRVAFCTFSSFFEPSKPYFETIDLFKSLEKFLFPGYPFSFLSCRGVRLIGHTIIIINSANRQVASYPQDKLLHVYFAIGGWNLVGYFLQISAVDKYSYVFHKNLHFS